MTWIRQDTKAFAGHAAQCIPGGVTRRVVACSSSVHVVLIADAALSRSVSFEELWDVAAVLEALHLGALWRFGDHLRRDQPME